MINFRVKRIYDSPAKTDGLRILIDRLWPRGIKKEQAKIDYWAKELTPSRELIAWFHEDKEMRYKEFSSRYQNYLKNNEINLDKIIGDKKLVSLVTAVKDIDHSHIPSLLKFLNKKK